MLSRSKALVSAALLLTVVLVAAACGGGESNTSTGGGDGGGKTVRMYIGGDVNVRDLWQKHLIPGFEKAFPGDKVTLTFSEHGTNDTTTLAKLGAAVKAKRDPGFDLADSGLVTSAALSGLLTKVGTGKIANLDKVAPSLLEPVKTAAAPYRGSSVVLAYDSSHVTQPPKTLDELLAWIKAHPGRFTYNSPNTGGSGGAFVVTVLDKYIPQADRAKMATSYVPDLERDWNKGFDALAGLNGSIYQKVYPNGNQDVINLLGKGQIWMAPVWSDMALSSMKTGLLGSQIKLTQITGPSFTGGAAYLGIPATSPNKDVAFKLVNWLLEPTQQQQIIDVLSGYPAIALDSMPAAAQKKFEGLETQKLRPGYEQRMGSDMNNLWQQKVPG